MAEALAKCAERLGNCLSWLKTMTASYKKQVRKCSASSSDKERCAAIIREAELAIKERNQTGDDNA